MVLSGTQRPSARIVGTGQARMLHVPAEHAWPLRIVVDIGQDGLWAKVAWSCFACFNVKDRTSHRCY